MACNGKMEDVEFGLGDSNAYIFGVGLDLNLSSYKKPRGARLAYRSSQFASAITWEKCRSLLVN